MDKFHIAVEELPELDTEVGISGTVKQQEVGGGFCVGFLVAVAVVAAS